MMSVAGQTEVASPGMASFQDFVLSAAPNVVGAKTYVTIRRAKREPGVPVRLGGRLAEWGEVASLTAIGREADLVELVDKLTCPHRVKSSACRAGDPAVGALNTANHQY